MAASGIIFVGDTKADSTLVVADRAMAISTAGAATAMGARLYCYDSANTIFTGIISTACHNTMPKHTTSTVFKYSHLVTLFSHWLFPWYPFFNK